MAVVAITLWLPVGMPGGTVEEWLILEQYRRGVSPLETGSHFLRPLVYVPFYIGFALTPSSFVGLNLLHMAFIGGKGFLLYRIMRALTIPSSFSLATALLFLVHPADDGQMSLRTLSVQAAVFLFLSSVFLLLRFTAENRPVLGLGMVACLSASFLIYEASLPLALLSPLLLLSAPGVSMRRAAWVAAGTWYGALVLLAGRYVYLLVRSPESYQTTVLTSRSAGGAIADSLPHLGMAFERSLWAGWKLALGDLLSVSRTDLLIALLIGGMAAGLLWLLARPSEAEKPTPRRYLVTGGIALLVIGLGFAMYLPTSVRESTWRTLFLSSLGGALFATSTLGLFTMWSRRRRLAFSLAAAVLVGLGIVHLLEQHRGFAKVSNNQRSVIEGIVEAVPRLHRRTRLLLLFDDTDQALSHRAFPFSRYLRVPLAFHYGLADLNVHICHPSTIRQGERCKLGRHSVKIEHQDVGWLTRRLSWEVPYDSLVAVHRDHRGEITMLEEIPVWYSLVATRGYDAGTLVDRGDGFHPASGGRRLEFDEGRFVGAGWGIERVNPAGVTYRFMTAPEGAIHLPLRLVDHRLRLRIANGMTPGLLASLGVSVGGQRLDLESLGSGEFRTIVDARLLTPDGDTTIVFHQDPTILTAVQASRGPLTGLGFDWVELESIGDDSGRGARE